MKQVALTFHMLLALPLSPLEVRADDGHGAEKLGVTIKELVNSTKEWDGQSLPSYPAGLPEIKVLRIKIPAGVTLPWHFHPVINAAVILKGRLELYSKDGMTKAFGPGEALIEVVNTVHAGKAVGSEDVELSVFYAGSQGQPTTVLSK
ncbi:cupin domain-containing protein [Synechococcus sp. MIT S1220]|uniref:cupin domain-containing protein n=1 Tax=Synechococcus sp. MIT S1220 TaxID=3082549 RepID=UPI0039B003DE